jgi:hypothetical protein
MRIITLVPKNKRAKQIIKQHGDRWEVIKSLQTILFNPHPGPWLYIQPLTEERGLPTTVAEAKIESATRWVHEHFDDNFKVVP